MTHEVTHSLSYDARYGAPTNIHGTPAGESRGSPVPDEECFSDASIANTIRAVDQEIGHAEGQDALHAVLAGSFWQGKEAKCKQNKREGELVGDGRETRGRETGGRDPTGQTSSLSYLVHEINMIVGSCHELCLLPCLLQ